MNVPVIMVVAVVNVDSFSTQTHFERLGAKVASTLPPTNLPVCSAEKAPRLAKDHVIL